MRILALDLATRLGWACGSLDPTPTSYGVFVLPKTKEDLGRFAQAYRDWFTAALDELEPTEVIYESPFLPKTTGVTTVRKLSGLTFVTELITSDRKIPVREANNWDVRDHFVGARMAPRSIPQDQRRKWIKDKVMAECARRGFRVAGDDDADALALLSFALSLAKPGFVLAAPKVAA